MGNEKLWIKPKNYLSTGLSYSQDAKPFEVPFIDLENILGGDEVIDLMKLDIEGGEFDFVRYNLEVFKKVNLLFMELHEASQELHDDLYSSLSSVGLSIAAKPLFENGHQLLIWHRL